MLEQAAFDRHLFQSTAGSKHVNLRFPEYGFFIGILKFGQGDYADSGTRIFNTGSPFNVVAGQGPRNIDQLVAHYEKLNADEEEKKALALASKES